jgi:geranylgeranyl reductase family protein
MKQHDLVVVGASVSGALAAKEAARRGLEVALLEANSAVGKQNKCAGLVSKPGLEKLGVDYRASVLNEIRGARFVAGNSEFAVGGGKRAFVLDRQAFDEECVKEAVDGGASLYLENRVKSLNAKDGFVEAVASEAFRGRLVIGADGASSNVAAQLAFPKMKHLLAYQGEWCGVNVEDKHAVSVILDAAFRGFFAWIVPVSESRVRVGFATSDYEGFRKTKKALFAHSAIKELGLSQKKVVGEFCALIPRSPRTVTQKDAFLLVGDAAGQVKATSGGGIVFGGLCAKIAGECSARHLLEGEKLDYDEKWRFQYGSVLKKHLTLRRLCDALPSAIVELCVAGAAAFGLDRLADAFGDMDFLIKPNIF